MAGDRLANKEANRKQTEDENAATVEGAAVPDYFFIYIYIILY